MTGRPKLVTLKRKLWPVGYTLKISFLGGTPEARKKVARYAYAWTEHANLKFDFGQGNPPNLDQDCRVYRPGDRSHIRISFSRPGYYSLIGTDCFIATEPRESMNFQHFDINPPQDKEYLRGIVIHDFGHAIGLSHEHQNPKATCGWNWPVIYRELSGPPNNWDRATIGRNMKQLNYHTNPQMLATKHDRKSPMHYSFPGRFFLDPNSECRVPQNTELSATDRLAVRFLYPQPGQPSARGVLGHAPEALGLTEALEHASEAAKPAIQARLATLKEADPDLENNMRLLKDKQDIERKGKEKP